ncbi:MAG: AraC family transcriptional regulator ligand-binding domain-containing protein [Planctomycetota bacterium]
MKPEYDDNTPEADSTQAPGANRAQASLARHLTSYALGLGFSMEEITERTSVKRTHLINPNDRVPDDQATLLSLLILQASKGSPATLHLASTVDSAVFGMWGEIGQRCEDLNEAIDAWVRFGPMLADRLVMERYDEGDFVVMECRHPGGKEDHGFMSEFGGALTYRLMRTFLQEEMGSCVERVEFQHAPLSSEESYREYFGAPVIHSAKRNAFLFHRKALSTKSRLSDKVAKGYLQAELELLEDQYLIPGSRQLIGSVLDAIARNVKESEFRASAVAERLNVSLRTLQRSLNEQGLALRFLIQEAREKRARDLLVETDLNIEEIAISVGYADAPTFSRAFRRWTGQSPTEFRSSALGGGHES